jgi:hypothetical protein
MVGGLVRNGAGRWGVWGLRGAGVEQAAGSSSPSRRNSWARLRKVTTAESLLSPIARTLPIVDDLAVAAQRVMHAAGLGEHRQQTDGRNAEEERRA